VTDAHLMDADCIHGKTWWECDECEALLQADPTMSEQDDPADAPEDEAT